MTLSGANGRPHNGKQCWGRRRTHRREKDAPSLYEPQEQNCHGPSSHPFAKGYRVCPAFLCPGSLGSVQTRISSQAAGIGLPASKDRSMVGEKRPRAQSIRCPWADVSHLHQLKGTSTNAPSCTMWLTTARPERLGIARQQHPAPAALIWLSPNMNPPLRFRAKHQPLLKVRSSPVGRHCGRGDPPSSTVPWGCPRASHPGRHRLLPTKASRSDLEQQVAALRRAWSVHDSIRA